jgi:hypothetical protein
MIYYSVRTRKALKERLSRLPLGLPHYSYGIVCKKFLNLFEETGIQVAELPMPKIYPSYRDLRRPTGDQSRPIHLMFKAFDEFRLLKGAYNIACGVGIRQLAVIRDDAAIASETGVSTE